MYVCFTLTGETPELAIYAGTFSDYTEPKSSAYTKEETRDFVKGRYEVDSLFKKFNKDNDALTYKGEGYPNSAGWQSASGYKTWYIVANGDCEFYVPDSWPSSSYLQLTLYNNGEIASGNYVNRWRTIDGNLPSPESTLSVSIGQLICFTVGGSVSDFEVYTDLEAIIGITLKDSIVLNESQIEQVRDGMGSIPCGKVSRSGNVTTLTNGNGTYQIQHIANSSINVDCYRVYSCKFTESGDYVWNGSDADGVMKLVGEDDFIGGLHGDEITTDMKLLVNGVMMDDGDFDEVDYDEVVLYCVSDIYHCNTSSQAGTKAFTRNKALTFNEDGMRVQNVWTVASDVTVNLCYFGMLSVYRLCADGETTMITGHSEDVNAAMSGASEETSNEKGLNESVIHTIHGDTRIRYNGPYGTENWGNVSNYDTPEERLKVYMGTVYTSGAGKSYSVGEKITGDYTLKI